MNPIITFNINVSTPEAAHELLRGLGLLGQQEAVTTSGLDPAAPAQPAGPAPVYPPQQSAYSPPAPPVQYAPPAPLAGPAPIYPPQQPAYVPPPAAPTAPIGQPPAYTMEDLSHAAAPLLAAGKSNDLQALLASFGVQAVTQLPKEQYGAFATALRGMGARI